jgi:hypothetical protein
MFRKIKAEPVRSSDSGYLRRSVVKLKPGGVLADITINIEPDRVGKLLLRECVK